MHLFLCPVRSEKTFGYWCPQGLTEVASLNLCLFLYHNHMLHEKWPTKSVQQLEVKGSEQTLRQAVFLLMLK
jgi:hypothetical protein